jgi:hypothetical protein
VYRCRSGAFADDGGGDSAGIEGDLALRLPSSAKFAVRDVTLAALRSHYFMTAEDVRVRVGI